MTLPLTSTIFPALSLRSRLDCASICIFLKSWIARFQRPDSPMLVSENRRSSPVAWYQGDVSAHSTDGSAAHEFSAASTEAATDKSSALKAGSAHADKPLPELRCMADGRPFGWRCAFLAVLK